MPKFPKTVYVKWEPSDNEPPYLSASERPDGEDGEKVGIYILKEIKTRRVVKTLV